MKHYNCTKLKLIEQKGMPLDHDFGYSFPLSSSLLKKEGRENENEIAIILIKSHAFQLDHSSLFVENIYILLRFVLHIIFRGRW